MSSHSPDTQPGTQPPDVGPRARDAHNDHATGSRRRWLGLGVIALSQLMIVIDATIVNVALPTIESELGISAAARQWVITAYTLAFGGLLLLGGRVADHAGRKRSLLIGLAGFAVASAVGGAASSLEVLLVARVVQGMFAALLGPAVLSLLTTTFTEPRERATAFAVFGAVASGGASVGLVLGGVLTTYLSWHWVLYVNVPIAVVAAIGAVAFLRDDRTARPGGADVPGAVLATGGLVALVWGFSEAAQSGWAAAATLSLLGVGAVLLIAFLFLEARVGAPLLPLGILAHRGRGGAYLAVLLTFVGQFGAFLFLTFYLQGVLGYSAVETGLAFLPMTLGILVASAIASQIVTRVPPRALISGGMLLAAAGMAALSGLEVTSTYTTELLPYLVMIGIGIGAVMPPAINLATVGVRPQDSGAASATVNTSQQVGASLGTALLNTIGANAAASYLASDNHGPEEQLAAQVHGFTTAAAWGSGILAVAAVIALALINTHLGATPNASSRDG